MLAKNNTGKDACTTRTPNRSVSRADRGTLRIACDTRRMLKRARRILGWLIVGAVSVSADTCSECHADIATRQTRSHHSHALRPILETSFAETLRNNPVSEAGGLVRYGYQAAANGVEVTTQRGDERYSALLEWTFGDGVVGHTAVGRAGGRYFEHRLSYLTELGRTSLTPGQRFETPATAKDAIGAVQSAEEAFRCFNCHATGVVQTDAGPDLGKAEPGVHCERCHGPAEAHIQAARAHRPAEEIRKSVFNPGHLAARAIVEFCGQCHRAPKPGQVSMTPELDDPYSVRFQPYGLVASRCFIVSKKLSCIGCHDPHDNARRHDDAFYSAKCLSCHAEPAKRGSRCRRTTKQDCLPCHMQRAEAAPYLTFTDHRIRVY